MLPNQSLQGKTSDCPMQMVSSQDIAAIPPKVRRHILIVGGGSDLQPRLRAAANGVRTSVLCRASVLPWVHKLEDNAAVVVLPDNAAIDLWLQFARALYAIDPFDGLTSLAEIDQDRAAAIAEDLGLHYHSRETIAWVHDKLLMRKRLSECGVENVPNALVHKPEEILSYGSEWGYPLILKPSRGRASTGISVVHSPADIPHAFARSSQAAAPRLEPSALVVEPVLQGKEISVEALSEGGELIVVAIIDKYKDDATKIELGHVVPAALDNSTVQQIYTHLSQVFDALQIRFGMTHSELILTSNGPRMVETHVRPAGDEIPVLIHDALGVDLPGYHLEQIAGLSVAQRLRSHLAEAYQKPRAAAIWFATIDAFGELLEIRGVEEASNSPAVRELEILLKPGTQLNGLISSYSRAASIRTVADSGEEALRLAQTAMRCLQFHVRVTDRSLSTGI